MEKFKTFQEIILKLQIFWSNNGCLLTQPSSTEVGAGTLNKNTFLKVLGPEEWSLAYVEPSKRPSDGRYAKNPNRLQHFYQFQVILKPPPKNIQKLYLNSLSYLSINPAKFDIQFIEDNWDHPCLGASGLGWEIRAYGMEITQYTYFQQCGGLKLDIPCCELTYGLERLAMILQDTEDIYELIWSILPSGKKIYYGDIHKSDEIEWCNYNFNEANITILLKHFNDNEVEAEKLMEKNLITPAYDYILKCSHIFNLLESRNAISVTERANYVSRIRKLSKFCAIKYLEQRKKLGFPMLNKK